MDAARAYDRARVRLRGASASTNFGLSEYAEELEAHAQSLAQVQQAHAEEQPQQMLIVTQQAQPQQADDAVPLAFWPCAPGGAEPLAELGDALWSRE